jgi:hypothetical protein
LDKENKMKSWKSRKFIVFGVSLALFLVNHFTGNHIDEDTMQRLMALVVAWLVSQGIADAGSGKMVEMAAKISDDVESVAGDIKEAAEEASKDGDKEKEDA